MHYDSRPVVLYNAKEKKVIGIFLRTSMVVKYLYKAATASNRSRVYRALTHKLKINKTIFDFPVAIRYANEDQINLMSGNDYKIMDGYPVPHYTRMKGYDSSAAMLRDEWEERNNRRLKELGHLKS